ncbi:hypothetical protein BRADI_3g08963v3 [Brachypodium distachyon]|uniref:Uncharacterized protein n=1 Tax=Brachypodium distachyon TaxID=15368 RepID=A0A0Q3F3M9_BRADI|nr:hypothetical protein BRADI_3g08963v3 [Brachypodium distachyon]
MQSSGSELGEEIMIPLKSISAHASLLHSLNSIQLASSSSYPTHLFFSRSSSISLNSASPSSYICNLSSIHSGGNMLSLLSSSRNPMLGISFLRAAGADAPPD